MRTPAGVDIQRVVIVGEAYFGVFDRRSALVRLALREIRDRRPSLPDGLIEASVETRCVGGPYGLDRLRAGVRCRDPKEYENDHTASELSRNSVSIQSAGQYAEWRRK